MTLDHDVDFDSPPSMPLVPTSALPLFSVSAVATPTGSELRYQLLPKFDGNDELKELLLDGCSLQNAGGMAIATSIAGGSPLTLSGPHVDGETMASISSREKIPAPIAIRMMQGVAQMLANAPKPHGALSAENIVFTSRPSVHLIGPAFSDATWFAVKNKLLPVPKIYAPESLRSRPTREADVYHLGLLLYLALTGTLYQVGAEMPGALGLASPEVDQLIIRCLSKNPDDRPVMANVAAALKAIASGKIAKAAPKLTEEDIQLEKYLVGKDGFDFGPYSVPQLLEQIKLGEVRGNHSITDSETGEKCKAGEHPLFGGNVREATLHLNDARRAQAEVNLAQDEKAKKWILYLSIALGTMVLALVAVFLIRSAGKEEPQEMASVVGDDSAGFAITVEAPKVSSGKKRNKRRGNRNTNGGSKLARSDADDIDTFDMSSDLGSERLSESAIHRVMAKKSGALARCGSGAVWLKIAGPTGKVVSVKVNGKRSGGTYKCISRVLQSLQFPKVDGPRTIAQFSIGR